MTSQYRLRFLFPIVLSLSLNLEMVQMLAAEL